MTRRCISRSQLLNHEAESQTLGSRVLRDHSGDESGGSVTPRWVCHVVAYKIRRSDSNFPTRCWDRFVERVIGSAVELIRRRVVGCVSAGVLSVWDQFWLSWQA